MWMFLLWLACSGNHAPNLPPEALAAKQKLVAELRTRDPQKVSVAAEAAARWEGQDGQLDRLIGDALANVLMNSADGLQLLNANPAPDDPEWKQAVLAAASRTGDGDKMAVAWKQMGLEALPFDHPVAGQVSRRMRGDPALGSDLMEETLRACMLLDMQPPVGRQPLDHPVSASLVNVGPALGATQVTVGRPIFRTDPDRQSGRGPFQCSKKVWLEGGWPDVVPRALTVALTDGLRKVFIDIRVQDGEPWAFAASDAVVAGRWLEAMKLWETPDGSTLVRARFGDGLWAQAAGGSTK